MSPPPPDATQNAAKALQLRRAANLADILAGMLNDISTLAQVLRVEFSAISNHEAEKLQEITSYKKQLVESINQATQMRNSQLYEMELQPNITSMQGFVEKLAPGPRARLKDTLKQLEQQLEACVQQNRINGHLIKNNQQTVDELIAILTGRPQPPAIYDQKGVVQRNHGDTPGDVKA